MLRLGTAAVSLLALLGLSVVGCGGQQQGGSQGKEEESPQLVTGSFVGEIQEIDSFVALVADEPQDGEEAREVRAYLCDGLTINEWFRGSVTGDDLDLSSENEVRLKGQLTSDAATGTFTNLNGDSVPFEASPATGIAGLYNVTLSDDGTLSGTSERGGQLEGQLGDQLQDGSYPVSGTITSPDGETQDFEAFASPEASGNLRWIALPDGRIRGGFQQGQGAGFGGGFANQFGGGGFGQQFGGSQQFGGGQFAGGGFGGTQQIGGQFSGGIQKSGKQK